MTFLGPLVSGPALAQPVATTVGSRGRSINPIRPVFDLPAHGFNDLIEPILMKLSRFITLKCCSDPEILTRLTSQLVLFGLRLLLTEFDHAEQYELNPSEEGYRLSYI